MINPNALFYSLSNQSTIIGEEFCVKWNDSRRSTDHDCPWVTYVEGLLTSKIVSSIICSICVIGKLEWFCVVMVTSKYDTKPKRPFSVELNYECLINSGLPTRGTILKNKGNNIRFPLLWPVNLNDYIEGMALVIITLMTFICLWNDCSDSILHTIHSDCDYIVEDIWCWYFLSSFAIEIPKQLFVCCIWRYVIHNLFHSDLKVQLMRCMNIKAVSALTNFSPNLLSPLQSSTGHYGNIFKA